MRKGLERLEQTTQRSKWNEVCAPPNVPVGAVDVHTLSVAGCTESIGLLRGSHLALSGLLAVGIDPEWSRSCWRNWPWTAPKQASGCRGYTMATDLRSGHLNANRFG